MRQILNWMVKEVKYLKLLKNESVMMKPESAEKQEDESIRKPINQNEHHL